MNFEIVAISMEREVERRASIKAMLDGLGVTSWTSFDATDGKAPGVAENITGYDPAKARQMKRELTPSEIATYDSHRRVWQYVASREHPVLVLESDASISAETLSICDRICGMDELDWGIIMLYYHECLPSFWGRRRLNGKYRLVKFANRRAYVCSTFLLSPQGARQLLLHGDEITMPVDNFMTGGRVDKHFQTYAVYPRAAQLSSLSAISSIEDERKGLRKTTPAGWLQKKTLFLRNFLRKVRKPKSWL